MILRTDFDVGIQATQLAALRSVNAESQNIYVPRSLAAGEQDHRTWNPATNEADVIANLRTVPSGYRLVELLNLGASNKPPGTTIHYWPEEFSGYSFSQPKFESGNFGVVDLVSDLRDQSHDLSTNVGNAGLLGQLHAIEVECET
jgi:hypothetical protein